MDKIAFPIEKGNTGAAVATLHALLKTLGYTIDPKEMQRKAFGEETLKTVRQFQKDNKLPESQKIDDATAKALNKLAADLGNADVIFELKGHSDSLSGIDGRLGAQTGKLTDIDGKLGAQTGKLTDIDGKLGAQTGKLSDIDGKLGAQTGKLSDIDGKLGAQTGKLTDIDGKLGAQTGKLTDIDGKFGAQSESLTGIHGQLESLASQSTIVPLDLNATGGDVKTLQEDLAKLGFTLPRDEVTAETFGVGTRNALLQIQKKYGLATTGILDEASRALVGRLSAGTKIEGNTLSGRVVYANGLPARNIALRLYTHVFGAKPEVLKTNKTDDQGFYVFQYQATKMDNLEVRAVRDEGADEEKEFRLSTPKYRMAQHGQLNLVAPMDVQGDSGSEFDRLCNELKHHVGDATLDKLTEANEDDERQDISLLHQASGWDARLIAFAATSAKLGKISKIPPDALYALLRTGLPTDAQELALVGTSAVEMALQKGVKEKIVRPDTDVGSAVSAYREFARNTLLARKPAGSISSFGDHLDKMDLGDKKERFADLCLNHQGSASEFWACAGKTDNGNPSLSGEQINTLKLQGKFAVLTGNNASLMEKIPDWLGVAGEIAPEILGEKMVSADFHQADTWESRLKVLAGNDDSKLGNLLPPELPGSSVSERLTVYASDLARKVRLNYPTKVVARMISTGKVSLGSNHADVEKHVQGLLSKVDAEGLRLGQIPFNEPALVARLLKDIPESAHKNTLNAAKRLQRIYQITPTDEALQTVSALGFGSATEIAAYPAKTFLRRFGHRFASRNEAELVLRKAQQVVAVTQGVVTAAKHLQASLVPRIMSASQERRDTAMKRLVGRYPSMESLFGSLDFCECEHDRSVLSPAAYLVDLLQSLEGGGLNQWSARMSDWKMRHGDIPYPFRNKTAQQRFQTEWQAQFGKESPLAEQTPYAVLMQRRPDIAHLPLTRENTSTALPYVDVVNEILEYYVAHDALDDGKGGSCAYDTATATTPELLAEPQNIEPNAYKALKDECYPLTLPFDLWLETTRQFLDYFGTPLSSLLETFRTTDELYAKAGGITAEPFGWADIFMETLRLTPGEVTRFIDPNILTDEKWQALYGYPSVRAKIQNPTNDGNATVSVSNTDAAELEAGLYYTYVGANTHTRSAEHLIASAVGALDSAGPGRATITFEGKWDTVPADGDLLVSDAPAMLKSAKALSRRLGVTYKELIDIVQTGFVNPKLAELVILYRLGASVQDARIYEEQKVFYDKNKDLIGKVRGEVKSDDQARYDELSNVVAESTRTGWNILDIVAPLDKKLADLASVFKREKSKLVDSLWKDKLDPILVLSDSDTGCNFDLTTLQYADGTQADPIVFLRINLFVRLWRKLGWSIEETDRALQTFLPNKTLDSTAIENQSLKTALIYLAHLRTLDERLKTGSQGRLKLLTLWSNIPRTGKNPLYAQLFLRPNALAVDPTFDDPLGQYLVKPNVFVKDHLSALQGALSLTADEIERILAHADKSLDGTEKPKAELSLDVVSLLYRHGLLAKALNLTMREFIALKSLAGPDRDPFTALKNAPISTIVEDYPFTRTLWFVDMADRVRESGFSIEDLEYLLSHHLADSAGKYRADPALDVALVRTLSVGIQQIRKAHVMPETNQEIANLTDERIRQELSLILPVRGVQDFFEIWNALFQPPVAQTVEAAKQLDPALYADEKAIEVSYNAPQKVQHLAFTGFLDDVEKQRLQDKYPSTLLNELLDLVQKQQSPLLQSLQKFHSTYRIGFQDEKKFKDMLAPIPSTLTSAEKDLQMQAKRKTFFDPVLPYLQAKLVRQFVIETLSAHTHGDPKLVEALLTDASLLKERTTKSPLHSIFATAGDPAANVPLPMEGYFELPATGCYKFIARRSGAGVEVDLYIDEAIDPVLSSKEVAAEITEISSTSIELKAGVPYRFRIAPKNGTVELLVQGDNLPRKPFTQLVLYPQSVIARISRARILLTKVLQLIQGLNLDEREMRYVLTTGLKDANGVRLSSMPTGEDDASSEQSIELFRQFLCVADYARLKRELAGENAEFIAVFERVDGGKADEAYELLASLSRRPLETIKVLATSMGLDPEVGPAEMGPEDLKKKPALIEECGKDGRLGRLWTALQLAEKLGVSVGSLVNWATPEPDSVMAAQIRGSLKARHNVETWRQVAQPIFDKLRQRKRDALVAYLLRRLRCERIEQLYEHFLVDPGMEPVVQTSRLRLAISSVQLFIQRALLNLEPQVSPSAIDSQHWQWMKRYRVWEANRKIFLFPENWLEPEFRDDKTHLFQELEGALLQGDVSNDLAEDAFFQYLNKLDALARLQIVATYGEENAYDPDSYILHVIGRTYNEPHKYFYRRYVSARSSWTPWEPVTADIEGDHVVAVVWRQRLNLFWLSFLDKPESRTDDDTKLEAGMAVNTLKPLHFVEIQLNWSEYCQGQWTPRASSGFGDPIRQAVPEDFDNKSVFVYVTKDGEGEDEGGVNVHCHFEGALIEVSLYDQDAFSESQESLETAPHATVRLRSPAMLNSNGEREKGPTEIRTGVANQAFHVVNRNSSPKVILRTGQGPRTPPFMYLSAPATRHAGKGPLLVKLQEQVVTTDGKVTSGPAVPKAILQQGDSFELVFSANHLSLSSDVPLRERPFFFQDDRLTFLVQPTLTETQFSKWEGWIPIPPRLDERLDKQDWWDVLPLVPMMSMVDKVDLIDPVDLSARVSIRTRKDWLTSSSTAVKFGQSTIGQSGRTNVRITAEK